MVIFTRIKYVLDNWKLLVHLLFRTYHFGVDNKWQSDHASIFGKPYKERYKVIKHYKEMRMRAFLGFIPAEEARMLFPLYSRGITMNSFKHFFKHFKH